MQQALSSIFLAFMSWYRLCTTEADTETRPVSTSAGTSDSLVWDQNGYIFYCPCHGRFGNQADQFLGTLAFAKALNRTLILPPWRSYGAEQRQMVPFNSIFQVEPLRRFHRVVLASEFMDNFGESHWSQDKRVAFCHFQHAENKEKPCTTNVQFFAEFWDAVGVPEFTASENIQGLYFDDTEAENWISRFPAETYPVIALRGPPAPFPVPLRHWHIQKYVAWSEEIQQRGDAFITEKFGTEPFLGVHLRNGEDWVRACDLLNEDRHGLKNLMASTQCLGENPSNAVTRAICLPTEEDVIRRVASELEVLGFKHLFIATDHDPYLKRFKKAIKNVNIIHGSLDVPQIDMYILGRSGVFIGNCVSSFSSFVRRERDVSHRPTLYFGISKEYVHEEL
ncbi:GDP-fucose protein O-fucosyltransferase 1-like [Paramacrobiotus metropolitanus]|uniref:GDP-fucose protein O-fucosyltransferase 1-like n=1 Tax=Paramacrobiotus metropolitanus TaxID=2943436 RepID=UPI0024456977|nr:GDP-fucose protein O-fucosyltransferase 1-like [Paramacrobiotus metropolitanus]